MDDTTQLQQLNKLHQDKIEILYKQAEDAIRVLVLEQESQSSVQNDKTINHE